MRPNSLRTCVLALLAGSMAWATSAVTPVSTAAAQQSFFDQIFGLGQPAARPLPRGLDSIKPKAPASSAHDDSDSAPSDKNRGGTYRTVCVRTCDGFYFPISFATTAKNFAEDQQKCQASCRDAQLFVYKNPGETMEAASDLSGRAYTRLPAAFLFRKTHVAQCGCRPAPWTETEMQRHQAYADAAAKTAPATVPATAPLIKSQNALAQASGAASPAEVSGPAPNSPAIASVEANGSKAAESTTTGPIAVKAPPKKQAVANRPDRARVQGVASTASYSAKSATAKTGNGGGLGLFSMGLGAQAPYVWPGDQQKAR